MRVLYLHGFASSPRSTKARFFASRFAERGVDVAVPALVEDFERMTLSSQLEAIAAAHAEQPAGTPTVIMGSSMGGYLAALYAARHPDIARAICLAPAFDFAARWAARLGEEETTRWRDTGFLAVHHYGENREARVGWQLMEDARRYEPYPAVAQPTLIYHGRADDVVPVEVSREFAARNPSAELHVVESGHELTDVMERMWEGVCGFLRLS